MGNDCMGNYPVRPADTRTVGEREAVFVDAERALIESMRGRTFSFGTGEVGELIDEVSGDLRYSREDVKIALGRLSSITVREGDTIRLVEPQEGGAAS